MKFLVCVLALAAAVSAQTTVRPFGNQYQPYNRYNQYNPYNQYNQYNPFQRNQYNPFPYSTPSPYQPFVSSTPAPIPLPIAPLPSPTPLPAVVSRVQNLDQRNANILRYENEINPDGSYSYYYETDNGIAAQEQGVPKNLGGNPPATPDVAQGSFSWTSPEGIPIAISYIADENGYQPVGNAIPVPPPIPPQIARALEYTARVAPQRSGK